MINKHKLYLFKVIVALFLVVFLYSCSGSNKNYDYQLSWSNFKIVNINVRQDYQVQNILAELGVSIMPEYIDIEVISGFENDNTIILNGTLKQYSWSLLTPFSQNYLRGYKGNNKIKTN